MKRLIALLLVLFTLMGAAFSFSSCTLLPGIFPDEGGSGNVGELPDDGGVTEDPDNDNDDDPDGGNTEGPDPGDAPDCFGEHYDNDNNDFCDSCGESVLVIIDFYVLNDLHGKFCDSDSQPGVDELATYLNNKKKTDDNVILLSSGDMWQGTAESNLSGGAILTEWMNLMDFEAMTLGNHEFDWGEGVIEKNLEIAEFPFLAINIIDKTTGKLADYCTPSVMVERDGIQIGIIGAIGDCYSSISSDKVRDVKFVVGNELAKLVSAESDRLRGLGADLIVYSIHDGHNKSSTGKNSISYFDLNKYYPLSLSEGAVDLVFESHTHQSYTLVDSEGVYHVQAGGENSGLSHVEIAVNSANGANRVTEANIVKSYTYSKLEDDLATEELEDKYEDIINKAYSYLGYVSKYYDDDVLEDKVAELYLEVGLETWGEEYDIFLGGGFLRTRSPYNLQKGQTTYADILSLLPFDNGIVLCSIKGYKLKQQFIYNDNSDYHISISDYGEDILSTVSDYETYYVIVDTYTAFYEYNQLTIIDYYDESVFARDLLAEAIENGEI